ncbi:MAG: hypothetical protein MUF64_19295 [Polyangiaceae bacterium]|jgi:hypothetical protein|nr:hypothetical protein [Polyangiaceae bacterium]
MKRLLFRCACSLVALSALLPAGCEDKRATGAFLVITSELASGNDPSAAKEIESIQIDWERANNSNTVIGGEQGNLLVGQEIERFPASLNFFDTPKDDIDPTDDRLLLKIKATTVAIGGKKHTISRDIAVTFVEQETKVVKVPLTFACLDKECVKDLSTCIDGECVAIKVENGASLPTYDESTFNAQFVPPACFDASNSGCFTGATLVKKSGIRFDPENLDSCEFDIPPSKGTDPERLNVAIQWAESQGRFTVLDFARESPTSGWTAARQKNAKGEFIRVTLPKMICSNLSYDPTSRVQGVVYAFSDTCLRKEKGIEVCAEATRDTKVGQMLCSKDSSFDPGILLDQECPACFLEDSKCIDNADCQAIIACYATCKQTKSHVMCKNECENKVDLCDPSSKLLAVSLLSNIDKCADKCK